MSTLWKTNGSGSLTVPEEAGLSAPRPTSRMLTSKRIARGCGKGATAIALRMRSVVLLFGSELARKRQHQLFLPADGIRRITRDDNEHLIYRNAINHNQSRP